MKKKEFQLPSTNGKDQLHVVLWKPDEKPYRGVMQISHGMIEYINRYDHFAKFMTEQGFVVIGNDHLGHGQTAMTEDDLGYMNAADASHTIVRDLHRVSLYAKKHFPDLPYVLLGHSMGSFLARRYAMSFGNELDALIVMGTGYQPKPVLLTGYTLMMVLDKIFGEKHRSSLMEKSAFGAYNRKIKKAKSVHAWVSSLDETVEKYDQDPFCSYSFTLKGYKTLFDTLWFIEKKQNMNNIPKNLPILFVSGEEDPVGSYTDGVKKVVTQYQKLGILDVSEIYYETARHEILNDCSCDQVESDIINWLNGRL